MAEGITLTSPIVPPVISGYTPVSLTLALVPTPIIVVALMGTTGEVELFTYPAAGSSMNTPASVVNMIQALNTANLSTRSLWRRVFDRLLLDFPSRFPGGATVT